MQTWERHSLALGGLGAHLAMTSEDGFLVPFSPMGPAVFRGMLTKGPTWVSSGGIQPGGTGHVHFSTSSDGFFPFVLMHLYSKKPGANT